MDKDMTALLRTRPLLSLAAISFCLCILAYGPFKGAASADGLDCAVPSLLPSENLVRNPSLPVRLDLSEAGLKEGSRAVDFTLLDILGNEVSLSERLKNKPVILILGSYT